MWYSILQGSRWSCDTTVRTYSVTAGKPVECKLSDVMADKRTMEKYGIGMIDSVEGGTEVEKGQIGHVPLSATIVMLDRTQITTVSVE